MVFTNRRIIFLLSETNFQMIFLFYYNEWETTNWIYNFDIFPLFWWTVVWHGLVTLVNVKLQFLCWAGVFSCRVQCLPTGPSVCVENILQSSNKSYDCKNTAQKSQSGDRSEEDNKSTSNGNYLLHSGPLEKCQLPWIAQTSYLNACIMFFCVFSHPFTHKMSKIKNIL